MVDAVTVADGVRWLEPAGHVIGGCGSRWTPLHNWLFQVAHTAILLSYAAPPTVYGVLFLHTMLIIGFIFLTIWGWISMCAPDILSWNFTFAVINVIQVALLVYRIRPIKFCPEIEQMYISLFKPLKVPRYMFKKLVSSQLCSILNLRTGEQYATIDITRTDRLALLISGSAHVVCNGKILHNVLAQEFLDSPEFESSSSGEDRFHVSVEATGQCRYIFWQRQALEHLFTKEPYLATVMQTIISRDITNKLYSLSEKVHMIRGSRLDIRLPATLASAEPSIIDTPEMAPISPSRKINPETNISMEEDDENADERTDMIKMKNMANADVA